jgi:hypothetical protein
MVIEPVTRASYPAPTSFKTVVAGFGADQVRYTVARHQITGTNRFGQNSVEFPFCLVNLAAWRRAPCDLRLAEWYRTEQESIAKYAPPPPVPEPEPMDCIASFAGGVQIEPRRENRSRFLMWEVTQRAGELAGLTSPAPTWIMQSARLPAGMASRLGDWQGLQGIKTGRKK